MDASSIKEDNGKTEDLANYDSVEIIEQLDAQLANVARNRFEIPKIKFPSERAAIITLACFASMGGLLSGIDQSLISGANIYMPKSLDLDTDQLSLISAGMPLGAIFGSLIISPCNELLGRRYSLLISIAFYTVGAALEAGATSFGMMMAGRLILGAGVGIEGGTVSVYVAESVPSRARGRLVSLYQFNIALGEVLGYVVAAIFVNVPSGSWRYMLGSSLLFSTIMGFGIAVLQESPRWLMHKGRELESFAVWKNMRKFDTEESRLEFLDMRANAKSEMLDEQRAERKHLWTDFFTKRRARNALIYANVMIALGQLTGINAIMYYMSTLMQHVGFDDKKSVFMSLVGGGALLIGTVPAILYMDRFGRRIWACLMLPCFFVGLVLAGISYVVDIDNIPAVEGTYITGLIIYCGFFGSYACLTWVIPSESFPTYLRSYGMTTTSTLLYIWTFVVTYNFNRMEKAMTGQGLLIGFYGGIAVLGWIYQLLFMPETNGKTLEELDYVFGLPTKEIVKQNLSNLKRFKL